MKCFIYFNIFLLVVSANLNLSSATTTNYNVLRFRAKGNGVTDSTQAFTEAWAAACASAGSTTTYVRKGRYVLGSLAFKGDCKGWDITFRIDGTLVAPADYQVLGQANNWLGFEGVNGVSIIGGAIDAKGSSLWACNAAGTNCPNGATVLHNFAFTSILFYIFIYSLVREYCLNLENYSVVCVCRRTLSFTNSNNIKISGLISLNSQMYHTVINGCQDVHVEGVKVIAAGNSPNTDGIHLQLSRNVVIMNSSIKAGDDCISIGPGTKNLRIERVNCGPCHGIN